MRTSSRTGGRTLAALLACALAACSSSTTKFSTFGESTADWDAAVERSVPDPARAANLKRLGRELVALQQTMAADFAALDEQAVALNADYQATAEDASRLSHAYQARRRDAFARYRDLVFAMRAEVSASEWKALTK
jgi:hypothetical protein